MNFLINKAQGGYFPPADIDLAEAMAQMSIYNDFMAIYVKTDIINAALTPFRVKYPFTEAMTANGVLNAPTGYLYMTGLRTTQYDNVSGKATRASAKIFKEDELGDALISQVCPPSASEPIANEESLGVIQLYPEMPQSGVLQYLRSPAVPVFGYTQVGRVITYNQSTSTNPEWRDTEANLVILKTVELLGITLSDPALVAFVGGKIANNFSSPVKA